MRPDYEARSRALVGARFRPQGRGLGGLDCVGLVIATYEISPEGIRGNYRLRGDHRREVEDALLRFFRRIPKGRAEPGDAVLLRLASDQLHLAVRTSAGFVHAHAGLRRVVETPGQPEWPVIGAYRRRIKERRG